MFHKSLQSINKSEDTSVHVVNEINTDLNGLGNFGLRGSVQISILVRKLFWRALVAEGGQNGASKLTEFTVDQDNERRPEHSACPNNATFMVTRLILIIGSN